MATLIFFQDMMILGCGDNCFTGKESWDVDDESVAGCDHG